MKLAFDLDDILASFQHGWVAYNAERYQSSVKYDDITDYDYAKVYNIPGDEVYRRIFEFYDSPYISNLLPVPGAQDLAKKLSSNHELFVLTSRPTELRDLTENWVNQNFPSIFKEVILTNQISRDGHNHKVTKADLCLEKDFGYLIDDAPVYINQVAAVNKKAIVVTKPWNATYSFDDSNVTRVPDISEVARVIVG